MLANESRAKVHLSTFLRPATTVETLSIGVDIWSLYSGILVGNVLLVSRRHIKRFRVVQAGKSWRDIELRFSEMCWMECFRV